MVRLIKISALFLGVCLLTGLTVYLTLSFMIKSEETVIVPDLSGKDVVSALELLTDMGLDTKITGSDFDAAIPKNHIIFQDPEAGAEIKKGRDIRLMISKGTQSVFVPNLTGRTLQQAGVILKQNGLCAGVTSYAHSDLVGKDHVIAQEPTRGKAVHRGDCANLLVSTGRRPVYHVMPDLTGMPLDEAIHGIEPYRLQLGKVTTVVKDEMPHNTIVGQEPDAGHRIEEGTTIRLVINRSGDKMSRSSPTFSSGVQLFRYRLKEGFLKKRMRVRVNCFGRSIDFFDGLAKPGTEIWVLIPRFTDATLFLYENNELIQTKVFDTW
jgi:beta-lactam-binding protein with PASTA domain